MSPRAPIGYYGSIYNRKSVNENIPGIEEVCFDESIHTICQIWIPEQYHNSNDLHYLACARTTNIAVASGLMVRTDQGWRVWGLKKNEEQIREIVYHDREIIWEMDGWDGDEDGLNGDFNCTRNLTQIIFKDEDLRRSIQQIGLNLSSSPVISDLQKHRMRSARGLQQLGSVNSLCQLPNLPELYFTPPELSNRIVSLLKDDIFLITIPKNVTKPSFWDDNWTLTAKTTSAAVAIGCYYLKKSNRGWSIHGLTLSDKEIQEVISVDCASEHDDSQGKLEVCGGWDSDEHGLNGFTNSSMNLYTLILMSEELQAAILLAWQYLRTKGSFKKQSSLLVKARNPTMLKNWEAFRTECTVMSACHNSHARVQPRSPRQNAHPKFGAHPTPQHSRNRPHPSSSDSKFSTNIHP